MKTKIYLLAALSTLAYFFVLCSVVGYEAGVLSRGAFICYCGGSVAVVWASLAAIDKIEKRQAGENERKRNKRGL